MAIMLEFTKNGNIRLPISKTTTAYAMPVPDPRQEATWCLFPDDRTWQERVAVNQTPVGVSQVRTGGIITLNGRVLGKLEELGDKWVFAEAFKVVLRTMTPRPEWWLDPDEGKQAS